MSDFKTLNSHESGVVWHQFSKVTKQDSYCTVKCNLCSNEDVFMQGRLKTMRYHLWTKHQDFYVENFGDEPQLSTSTSSVSTLSSSAAASNVSTLSSSAAAKPETTRKLVRLMG